MTHDQDPLPRMVSSKPHQPRRYSSGKLVGGFAPMSPEVRILANPGRQAVRGFHLLLGHPSQAHGPQVSRDASPCTSMLDLWRAAEPP